MLLNELIKNGKRIIRNWSSLLLLVAGPLLMMLIIALTFGADDPHSIVIGQYGDDFVLPQTNFSTTQSFPSRVSCTESMRQGQTHLCLGATRTNSSQVRVEFVFDPSEKKLSNLVVASIKELLGEQASDISIEATESLLDQVQELVVFLSDRQDELDVVVREANTTREQLIVRLDRLKALRSKVNESRDEIERLADQVNTLASANITSSLLDTRRLVDDSIVLLSFVLSPASPLVDTVDSVALMNGSVVASLKNGSRVTLNSSDSGARSALILYSLRTSSQALSDAVNASRQSESILEKTRQSVKNASDMLVNVFVLLDEEIRFNEEAIRKIDVATDRIAEVQVSFSRSVDELALSDPDLAQSIVNPIVEEFVPLTKLTSVESVFPGLVIIVIVFITLLFGTILTLGEIHSPAYFRNLISPSPPGMFTAGLMVTNMILVIFQVTVLLIIGQLYLGVSVFADYASLYGIVVLLTIIFSLLGASIAFIVKGEQTSILTTTFSALAFYLFSNLVTPLELMPMAVSRVAAFNPVVIGEVLLRRSMLFQVSVSVTDILPLLAWVLVGIVLVWFTQSRFIRRLR